MKDETALAHGERVRKGLGDLRRKMAIFYGYDVDAFNDYDSIPSSLVAVNDWLTYFGFGEVLSDEFVDIMKTDVVKGALMNMSMNIGNVMQPYVKDQISELWFNAQAIERQRCIDLANNIESIATNCSVQVKSLNDLSLFVPDPKLYIPVVTELESRRAQLPSLIDLDAIKRDLAPSYVSHYANSVVPDLPAKGIADLVPDRAAEVANILNNMTPVDFCGIVPCDLWWDVYDELNRRIGDYHGVNLSKIEAACRASEYVGGLAGSVASKEWGGDFNILCGLVPPPTDFDPLKIGNGAMDFRDFVRSELPKRPGVADVEAGALDQIALAAQARVHASMIMAAPLLPGSWSEVRAMLEFRGVSPESRETVIRVLKNVEDWGQGLPDSVPAEGSGAHSRGRGRDRKSSQR
jgi:hypothetical protein